MKVVFLIAASALLLAGAAAAATHTWTGAVNTLWSNNGNWTGGTPAGDPAADLVFPAGPAQLTSTDDIVGVSFLNSISFTGGGYTINSLPGNSVALAGDISVAIFGTSSPIDIQLPIALFGGVEHFVRKGSSCCSPAFLTISGVISGPASDGLTFSSFGGLASNGDFDVTLAGNNIYAGPTNISGGFLGRIRLFVMGFQPSSSVTGGTITQAAQLRGTGTVGPLNVYSIAPGTVASTGVLHSVGNGLLPHDALFRVRLNGTTVGSRTTS